MSEKSLEQTGFHYIKPHVKITKVHALTPTHCGPHRYQNGALIYVPLAILDSPVLQQSNQVRFIQ